MDIEGIIYTCILRFYLFLLMIRSFRLVWNLEFYSFFIIFYVTKKLKNLVQVILYRLGILWVEICDFDSNLDKVQIIVQKVNILLIILY